MGAIADNELQDSSSSLSSFVSSGFITGDVNDATAITTFLYPSTRTSATASEVDNNGYDGDTEFPSPTTTNLGFSTSNSTSVSSPTVPAQPPTPTNSAGAPSDVIATGKSRNGKPVLAVSVLTRSNKA